MPTVVTFFKRKLPARRTERFAIRNSPVGHARKVGRLGINRIAPPRLNGVQRDRAVLRVLQSKEDDDETDSITRIQSSRQHIYHIARQKLPPDSFMTQNSQLYLDHQPKYRRRMT